MIYISEKNVSTMSKLIKETFPDFKLSVTRVNQACVNVTLLEGPLDFGMTYCQINPYTYKRTWKYNGSALKMFNKIISIMNSVEEKVNVFLDSESGSVPSYFQHIDIGKYNSKYILNSDYY